VLAIFNSIPNDAFATGAITPFTVLEAETGTLGGGATIHAFTPGSTVPAGQPRSWKHQAWPMSG